MSELLDRLPLDPLVLEARCGDSARTLANLSDDCLRVDFFRAGLEFSSETVPMAHLLQVGVTAIPVTNLTLGGITTYPVAFHVPQSDHPAVYREVARVLNEETFYL